MSRRFFYFAIALTLVFAALAFYEYNKPATFHGVSIDPPKPMPDLTLQSDKGPVKLSDFRGKLVALYFGYTSCPDICPTTLAALSAAIQKLDPQSASQVQVVFASVDYKRDTPAKVASYARNFSPDFVGLGGTKDQIDQATQEFGIYYKLDAPDPATGAYTVEHTATVLLLNRKGEWVATWPYGETPVDLASDLQILLKK